MNPDIAVPATSADLPPAVLHTRDARGVHSLVVLVAGPGIGQAGAGFGREQQGVPRAIVMPGVA